jgi:hypothetical protein
MVVAEPFRQAILAHNGSRVPQVRHVEYLDPILLADNRHASGSTSVVSIEQPQFVIDLST